MRERVSSKSRDYLPRHTLSVKSEEQGHSQIAWKQNSIGRNRCSKIIPCHFEKKVFSDCKDTEYNGQKNKISFYSCYSVFIAFRRTMS